MRASDALATLHSVVDSDSYAMSFQGFGQYRTAIKKHIRTLYKAAVADETRGDRLQEDLIQLAAHTLVEPQAAPKVR